jgi:CBS domain-containing protein
MPRPAALEAAMNVSEVMTRNVQVVKPQSGVAQAAQLMKQFDCGCLPVVDGRSLVGMVTDRDIATRFVAEGRDPATSLVDDIMTPTVVHAYEDQELKEAAEVMASWQVRRLPVLDRNGRLVGILALGDLVGRDLKSAGLALQHISQPAPVPVQS